MCCPKNLALRFTNIRSAMVLANLFASSLCIAIDSSVPGTKVLDAIVIPNADNVRGYLHLPTELPAYPGVNIRWKSSHPDVVSDKPRGRIAAGVVKRPTVGSDDVTVHLTACLKDGGYRPLCRQFPVKVQPSIDLAQFSRYAMTNFARSNSNIGQQVYFSTSGMHGTRDPVVVRTPEDNRFFLIASDLNVDGIDYGWKGWDWAQSGASRYIEVWESDDLRNWSQQRHVLVSPEEAGMTYAPEAIWDPEIGEFVLFWTSSMYPKGTHYSSDKSDHNGRYPLTGGQTLYSTTRDFVNFSPAKVMTARTGHGTLDPVIIPDGKGYYQRIVSHRNSTGTKSGLARRQENPWKSSTADVGKPDWQPINWTQKPDYDLSLGLIRHGHIWSLTTAEHAALRGANLRSIDIIYPKKRVYRIGESLDLEGMVVSARYSDGITDDELFKGYGGYSISGFNSCRKGKQTVNVSYSVVGIAKSASFTVTVDY
ncbi:arabinosidase [Fusarium acutatum]|uniref:Arabinosidase n=1 Tax=Fusarium acutatum TaxID=78861 RepID=A0A8H4JUB9_9HYPO|nr:arabinosidase [Fusarium acutatum]